ncbi:hypothetical protein HBE96_00870 [Clostridium sp. P21]|uniref:Uncharacterized protein n=1 Tax=Clostridium muellerianum TaxID=2716538 RepID=A0A7Y0HKU4_9CLOT|nr:hypothetical protein [Clostridium muellerianum]NMM61274.1 hypothetical protein [Clostridium muellerianum]
MEFRLNKIDPEVRQRVKETTSAGKIHTKSGIAINKDNKKNKNGQDFSSELEKQKDKRKAKKIYVDALKSEEVEVSVYKEEKEDLSKDEIKGYIIDIRK